MKPLGGDVMILGDVRGDVTRRRPGKVVVEKVEVVGKVEETGKVEGAGQVDRRRAAHGRC